MGTALAATDANFETEVLHADVPVLVDFWATWCGPCRAVAPIVEKLAEEYAGRLKVAKVDVDSNPGISFKYGIRAIPTLYLFKGGEVVAQIVGALPKQEFEKRIIGFLPAAASA
jgi:thioredoxin 1